MRILKIFVPLFLLALISEAQQLNFYTINERNNLPSNEVYQVIQGDDGYMYIGCSAGLYSYDGFTFMPIKGKGQNAKSISNLYKDESGKLWCQNFAGQIYFVRNDSLILFRDYSEKNLSIPPFAVYKTNVWIALPEGLVQIKANGEETLFPYPDNGEWNVNSLSAADGFVYITEVEKGFYSFDAKTSSFNRFGNPSKLSHRCQSFYAGEEIFTVCKNNESPDYELTAISGGRVVFEKRIFASQFSKETYFIRKTGKGFWMGTSSGAFYFTDTDFKKYNHHLFAGENVSSVTADREGNLWFTTLGDGIHVVPSTHFMTIQVEPGLSSANHITAFHATSSHQKYFGTTTGDVYQLNSRQQCVKLQGKSPQLYKRVTGILSYKENLIVARSALSIYDKNKNETVYALPYIRDMVLIDSLLYIGSSAEFGVFNLDTRQYITIRKTPVRKITGNRVTGEIVISGNKGVEMYYNNQFKNILDGGEKINATTLRYTYSTLWVGTMNNEVLGIDGDEITHRITAPEFRGTTVYSMYSLHDDLYFTTEAGLHFLNLANDSLRFFGKRLMADFQGVNMIGVEQDTIYLATHNGLFLFPKKIINRQNLPLPIAISAVSVDGEFAKSSGDLTLDQGEGLKIYFKSISFSNPNAVSYLYRLKGLTHGWVDLNGIQDHVYFESLSPGNYIFEVTSVDSDGIVSMSPASLQFTVARPLQQQWWFQISLIVLVAAFIFGGLALRNRLTTRKG